MTEGHGGNDLSCALSQVLELGPPEQWRDEGTHTGQGLPVEVWGSLGVLRSNSQERPGGGGSALLSSLLGTSPAQDLVSCPDPLSWAPHVGHNLHTACETLRRGSVRKEV